MRTRERHLFFLQKKEKEKAESTAMHYKDDITLLAV